jgi:hypothetical protein
MHEIIPGVRHWLREHPKIHQPVSSYLLAEGDVALNPLLPEEGVEGLRALGGVSAILLTNRHHVRDVDTIIDAFGATLHVPEAGVEEVGRGARAYRAGDALPGGAVALEVGAISPDEMALHLPAHRAIVFADGLIRDGDGPLSFVPDALMGDDPAAVKEGLLAAFRRLIELEPEHLLLAHGPPVMGDGAQALADFVAFAEIAGRA